MCLGAGGDGDTGTEEMAAPAWDRPPTPPPGLRDTPPGAHPAHSRSSSTMLFRETQTRGGSLRKSRGESCPLSWGAGWGRATLSGPPRPPPAGMPPAHCSMGAHPCYPHTQLGVRSCAPPAQSPSRGSRRAPLTSTPASGSLQGLPGAPPSPHRCPSPSNPPRGSRRPASCPRHPPSCPRRSPRLGAFRRPSALPAASPRPGPAPPLPAHTLTRSSCLTTCSRRPRGPVPAEEPPAAPAGPRFPPGPPRSDFELGAIFPPAPSASGAPGRRADGPPTPLAY